MKKSGIYGVDACRGGWIAYGDSGWIFAPDMAELLHITQAAQMLVDIPIGLSGEGYIRGTDAFARRTLGSRGASVFNAPCRRAVYAKDYASANTLNRIETGKGLSKQSWNLCACIREVDIVLRENPALREVMLESHPELNFKRLNGNHALRYSKKQAEGIRERLEILTVFDACNQQRFNLGLNMFLRKHVQADDLLDALCLFTVGQLGSFPLEIPVLFDACGIPVAYQVPELPVEALI